MPGDQCQRDRPQQRLAVIFVVVALALLMSSVDQTIVATALSALQHGLHTSIVWAGSTITIYSFGQVLVLPLAGRLSDQFGRRRVFLASVVLFTAASLCCGLAADIYVLVALRAVQAIGGAGFTPSATGIVVDHFGPARDRVVGLFGSIFPIGSIIGPILGGVFVAYWSWRGIFLINVPIGIVLIVLCLRYVPRDPRHHPDHERHLDLKGMGLLGGGLLAAMGGVSYLGSSGARALSASFLVPEMVCLLAIALFLRHIGRTPDPFIPPWLIRGRGFAVINVINFLYGGAAAGLGALIPLYGMQRYGISTLNSGTLLSARGIATIALSSLAVYALRRTGYRWPMFVGLLVVAIGMFALAWHPIGLSPYAWLATAAGLTGVGLGWAGPASRNACLQLAPEQSPAIAGLRSTCRQAGSITAIAITTVLLAHADDPGVTQGHIYAVFGFVLLALTPLLIRVPEHRGSW